MMELKPVGMMKFPIYGKIKFMFQTTNQYTYTVKSLWINVIYIMGIHDGSPI